MASSKTRDPWQQQQQNRLRFTTMSRENINDIQVDNVNYLKTKKKYNCRVKKYRRQIFIKEISSFLFFFFSSLMYQLLGLHEEIKDERESVEKKRN